jgi:hypothetical protein
MSAHRLLSQQQPALLSGVSSPQPYSGQGPARETPSALSPPTLLREGMRKLGLGLHFVLPGYKNLAL